MTKPIIVYLAGAVDREPWRNKVVKECQDLPVEFVSPIDNISYSYQSLCAAHKKKGVFHLADRIKIDQATIVFAYIREGSESLFSGTSWELGYAYAHGKFTILVNDMPPGKACKYELIRRMSDVYHTSLDEAIDDLRELATEMMFTVGKEDK
jgi:nucleoside 2-deoxyribosyltransferase